MALTIIEASFLSNGVVSGFDGDMSVVSICFGWASFHRRMQMKHNNMTISNMIRVCHHEGMTVIVMEDVLSVHNPKASVERISIS